MITTLVISAVAVVVPFTSLGRIFGFTHLPPLFLLLMGIIVVLYIVAAEVTKKVFYQRLRF